MDGQKGTSFSNSNDKSYERQTIFNDNVNEIFMILRTKTGFGLAGFISSELGQLSHDLQISFKSIPRIHKPLLELITTCESYRSPAISVYGAIIELIDILQPKSRDGSRIFFFLGRGSTKKWLQLYLILFAEYSLF